MDDKMAIAMSDKHLLESEPLNLGALKRPPTDAETLSSDDTATTSSGSEQLKPKVKEREVWANKIDFLLACIGFSVGLGNVWRFPFLCYRNGGGAFLIPYFVSVVLGGIPVFFLEVSLGQFMAEGGIGTWKISPLFQGIGFASAIIVFLLNCEYNIILTWSFYYLFSSFTAVLPWSHGDNDWNSEACRSLYRTAENASAEININVSSVVKQLNASMLYVADKTTELVANASVLTNKTSTENKCDPVTEFWERKVLQLSSGVDHPGNLKWDLALCLLLAWIVVYFCIWKGIKSSGKVMYFTATSPYVLMFVLLIRGVTLDGAMEGIKYYLLPEWSKLADPQVWVDAGTQIFFSYSISLGTLTALGSYNRFSHNVLRDSIVFASVNSFTSILSGFVIFSVLGFMAKEQGVNIEDVAESGPGLAFIAYPEAVSQMPVSPLWSILFFIMILLLGLDSQFVGVEGFVTAIVDMYPEFLRRGKRREILIGIICIICFFIGLSMVTELFDYYSASRIVLVVAFFECIVVAYIYVFILYLAGLATCTFGFLWSSIDDTSTLVVHTMCPAWLQVLCGVGRFYDNLEMMFGFRINRFFMICWTVVTPLFTMGMFILGAISYSELEYKRKTITYQYPDWAIGIGWTLACISVVWIPGIMVYRVVKAEGRIAQRFLSTTKPILRRHQLREGEDLSKVILIEDNIDDCESQSYERNTLIEPPSYQQALLADSVELHKSNQDPLND